MKAPFSGSPKTSGLLTPLARHYVEEVRRALLSRQEALGEEGPGDRVTEREITEMLSHLEELEGQLLTDTERTSVVAHVAAALDDFDILTPLVNNPEVNDIVVAAYDDISIQVGRKNYSTGLSFESRSAYQAFVESLLKRIGKACTTATPVVDAAITPHIRVCVTHESFSPPPQGPMLTLRMSRHQEVVVDALVHYELAPRPVFEYLVDAVRSGAATILISGEVATGKTTLLRALAAEIDTQEALLIIEDTHEIVLRRPFVRTLLTRDANTEGAGKISPAQAIRAGLRMAMNRIILGEMRCAEAAEAFLDVCSSGHVGLSTLHARSSRDALSRLELFLVRAQGQLSADAIQRQIANAVSVLVHLGVDGATGQRRILEVHEVGTAADGHIQLTPIFQYHGVDGIPSWKRESTTSRFGALHRTEPILRLVPAEISFLSSERGAGSRRLAIPGPQTVWGNEW